LLLLLVAAFYLGGRALPDSYTISSELEIGGPPSAIYGHVDDAESWTRWFTGPDGDVRVESERRLVLVVEDVEHVLELTQTSSPTGVEYKHFSEGAGALEPIRGRIDIAARDGGSLVRIEEVVSVPASTQRWLVYLFGRDLMAQVLSRELHNLGRLVEGDGEQPAAPASDASSGAGPDVEPERG
jgi:hypothetical protein